MDDNISRRLSLPSLRTEFCQAPEATMKPEENNYPSQLDLEPFDEIEEIRRASGILNHLGPVIGLRNDVNIPSNPARIRYETPHEDFGNKQEDERLGRSPLGGASDRDEAWEHHEIEISKKVATLNHLVPVTDTHNDLNADHSNSARNRCQTPYYGDLSNEREDERRNRRNADEAWEQDESIRRGQINQRYDNKVTAWQRTTDSDLDIKIYTLEHNVFALTQKCQLMNNLVFRERRNILRVQAALQLQVETTTQAVEDLVYVSGKRDELTRENEVLRKQMRDLCQAFNQADNTGGDDWPASGRSRVQFADYDSRPYSKKRRQSFDFYGERV